MEKRRWRTRLIVVAVLAVLVLVFGPKKLGWLVPGPDEAVTGYAMYRLFSSTGPMTPPRKGWRSCAPFWTIPGCSGGGSPTQSP